MVSPSDHTDNRLSKWVNTLLVLAIAWAGAGLTIQLLPDSVAKTNQNPVSKPIERQNTVTQNPLVLGRQVAAAHLFGEAGKEVKKAPPKPKIAPETKLNLTLAGVFAYDPQDLAVAIISSGGREEQVYGIGDKIGNATLKAVYPDKVIIENRGREETLKLPDDVAPIALPRVTTASNSSNDRNQSGPIELPSSPRALRDKLVKNPSMLGKIVSATPYQEGGKLVGYRLQPKQNAEILESQGIMANDVITRVNGIGLNSQKQGIRALRKLVKADNIELTVLRDGIEVPVMISLDQ